MTVQSAQSITVLFTTRVFSTGVGTNATGTPTGTLYKNGVANAATVTVANVSTGLYTAQVTLPTLAFGDEVQLIIAATVSGVADTAVIWGDTNDLLIDANNCVKSDVVDIAGSAVSTSTAQLGVNLVNIAGSTTAASQLALSAATIISGTVTGSPTSTSFIDTSLSGYSITGALIGRVVYFTSGSLKGQVQIISAYNGSTNQVTVATAYTGAPSNGDAYIII